MKSIICLIVVYTIVAGGQFYVDAFAQRRKAKYVCAVSVAPTARTVVRRRFFSGFKTNGLRHWWQGEGKRRVER